MEGNNEFDMSGAVSEIAEGLGFEVSDEGGDDAGGVDLNVSEGSVDPGLDAGGDVDGTSGAEGGPASDTDPATDPAAPSAAKYDPPKTWRPEALASWEAIPEAAKAEILKREEDIFKGLEGYKADANVGRITKQVFQPYMAVMQQEGVNPADLTGRLLNSHFNLLYAAPEVKLATFQALAREYGVPIEGGDEPPYVDPQVEALRKELNSVTSTLKADQQRQMQTQLDSLTKEIDVFASDPAHQYFEEVATDIAALLRAGAATTLKDAYDKAVWANPVTRAKEQARVSAESAQKAAQEAKAKAQAARRATSANVRPTAKAVSGTAPLGSIDDTLQAAFAKIQARESR